MLILRPRRIADQLRAGTLPEATKARLVLVGYVATLVFGSASSTDFKTWGDVLLSAVAIGIVIGGFWNCFRANQRGDGRAFIERYMCLSVPLTIWLYGGYLGAYYFAFWMLRDRPGFGAAEFARTVRPYLTFASLAVLGLFFLLMRSLLRDISRQSLSSER